MDPKHDERLQNLDTLIWAISDRAKRDFAFRRAIGALQEDLSALSSSLSHTPDAWRLNRAFHTVHVPSLLAVVSMLDGLDDMTSVTPEDQHQINASLHRASQLAADARRRIERAALGETMAELAVLAEYAPPTTEVFKAPTVFERTLDGVVSASRNMGQGAAALASRAGAVPTLAHNLQRSLAGALSDHVTKPIEMRLQASATALKYGAGTGVGVGIVTAVLFPPLLPISAGGAVLAAMYGWRSKMEATRKLNASEREQRLAELAVERREAIAKLTNGASVFQMETDEISLTVDAESGHVDGVILQGEHANRSWADLNAIEKAEVAATLTQGADVLLGLLELGTDSA
ncbi:MAG: hypothetical protein AAGA87_08665 [Pseudomonadota bacterium]